MYVKRADRGFYASLWQFHTQNIEVVHNCVVCEFIFSMYGKIVFITVVDEVLLCWPYVHCKVEFVQNVVCCLRGDH